MNYAELISKAFRITLKYKFLWLLGILASFTQGGVGIPNFNLNLQGLSDLFKETPQIQEQPSSIQFNLDQFPKVLGDQVDYLTPIINWISSHLFLIVILGISFLLFLIALFVISTMAKGGLIASVLKIEKKEGASFKIGFGIGYHAFWRIFGIGILIGLSYLLLLFCLGVPVFSLVLIGSFLGALALGFLLLPILIVVGIYLGILSMYAIRFTVCQSFGVIESLKKAHRLIMRFKKEVLLVWLISLGIGIGIAIALGLLSLLLLLLLVALGMVIYAGLGLVGTLVYSLTLGLILFVGFLILGGIIQTFQSSFWTLAYLELSQKEKTTSVPAT